MNMLVRFVAQLIKFSRFQRINVYRQHWAAYVGHLEGVSGIESRYYYLGFGFVLTFFGFVVGTADLVGVLKQLPWLNDPWNRTLVFINFFPSEIRKTQTVAWFCFNLEAVLGLGYELFRRERAPIFMRIYTTSGLAALDHDGYRAKFKRFERHCLTLIKVTTFSFYTIVVVTITIYGYFECYSVSPTFYVFWSMYIILQTQSSAYITITVPVLLCMSSYYLQLLQQMLLAKSKQLMNKRAKNRVWLMKSYEQLLARYVSANHLLSEFNQFWSFYLYVWIQVCPIMITYLIYALINNKIQSMVWIKLYINSISLFTMNLLLVVYVSTEVSKRNQLIAKNIAYIFQHNLQASLAGDLRRHLHLQGAVDHARLGKYTFRSISNQIIDNKTYFLLFFKFAFVYLKLTNLSKNSLESSDV